MKLAEFERTIDRMDYPTTTEMILREFGSEELDVQDGTERLDRLFEQFGPESFASPDEVKMTLYGALPDEAVGRKGYSDRDPPGVGEVEQLSF